ncbi:MAG: hypothetical protein ABEH65_06380 [Halobacteriales archaeon]
MAPGSNSDQEECHALLDDLHASLTATEELPVETTASRWLGEAQAIVTDLVDDMPESSVLATRLEHVDRLLNEIESTEHPEAEDHLDEAIETVGQLRERLP